MLEAVKRINAKTLYPIHTEHPQVYKSITNNLVLVEEGLNYRLGVTA